MMLPWDHPRRRFLVTLLLMSLLGALAVQAQVVETFPPNGSLQTLPCGPFGARLQPGSATDLLVRGSATGIRTRGETHLSALGDTVLFTPAIPFAPGEVVTLTVDGYSWQTTIRPTEEHRSESPGQLQPRTISLSPYYPAQDLEFLAWSWADLDGDRDQEGVLLVSSGGATSLLTVARQFDWATGQDQWLVRPPALCDTDNPVDLKTIDLNGDARRDLVLLSLGALLVWTDPGAEYSPNGAEAATIGFPAGFNSRSLVCGDLDNDGDDDVVVLGLFGLQYLPLLNDGQGHLQPQTVRVAAAAAGEKSLPWPIRTLLADADGDGRLDLIWSADYQEQGAYRVRLARGLGTGEFEAAQLVTETQEFSRGLQFGRLIDPWDDSITPAAIMNALPDQDRGLNYCGFTFDGSGPVSPAGCLTLAGISTQSLLAQPSHFLAAPQPEIWYADAMTGALTACTLDAAQSTATRALDTPLTALAGGDFDFDGDGDLALLAPQEPAIILLQTPGGVPQQAPVADGLACGGLMDFGTREVSCPADAPFGHLSFTNEGLLPSRVTQIDLDDPDGVFQLGDQPTAWFGAGCLGPASSVLLPVNFTPDDTLQYTGNLTVTVDWVGAAADGSDSTIVCEFLLQGRGGIHGVDDAGTGPGTLLWSADQGYQTTGSTLDFGTLPAMAEIIVDLPVSLTNTGRFPVEVVPPADLPAPFFISPSGAQQLAPGQTTQWTVQANPHTDLLPAGVDSLDLAVDSAWIVRSLNPTTCLPPQTLNQHLTARLLAAQPRLVPDPGCSGQNETGAVVDTLIVSEDGSLGYCLREVGWTWPGAQPQLRVVDNPLSWLNITEGSNSPVIHLGSDLVGAEGGDLQLEVRDTRFPTVVRPFTLTVVVEPSRPDLAVVGMMFQPLDPDGDIQQQHPFLVDVVVEVTRQPVSGALMGLEGGPCTCGVDPLEKVLLNLEVGRRDTVRFMVESCGEAGECPFTACIEPPGGLDGDFNPDNNCFTLGALVGANRSPVLQISNLVLTPEDPTLEPCQNGITLNDVQGGMVQAFGVREGNNLSFDVLALDPDGDDTRLTVGLLPPFVVATASGDTMVSIDITPPEGTVTREVCEQFGPLVFQVVETAAVFPETTLVEIPLYVKWEGPDLQATLTNVPASAGLTEDVRFNGQVRCLGYDAGPFTVDLWLENPEGMRVAGRQVSYDGLESGRSVTLPQVMFNVDRPGEYCAHLAVIEGRDVNPDNNSATLCFPVASGPFVVSPNVTTPNGDGHNDQIVFRFMNQTMAHPRVRIFQLNGHQVFETDHLDAGRNLTWDGRDQSGHPLPPGTYLYVVYNDRREFRTGTCGVVR